MTHGANFTIYLDIVDNQWRLTPLKKPFNNGQPDPDYQVIDYSIKFAGAVTFFGQSGVPGVSTMKPLGGLTYTVDFLVEKTSGGSANCQVTTGLKDTYSMQLGTVMCDGNFRGSSTGDVSESSQKDDEIIGSFIADRAVRIDTALRSLSHFAPETRGKWESLQKSVVQIIGNSPSADDTLVDEIVTAIEKQRIFAKEPYKLAYELINAYSVNPVGPPADNLQSVEVDMKLVMTEYGPTVEAQIPPNASNFVLQYDSVTMTPTTGTQAGVSVSLESGGKNCSLPGMQLTAEQKKYKIPCN